MPRKTVRPVGLLPSKWAILYNVRHKSSLLNSDFPKTQDVILQRTSKGRLLALDLGARRVGIAVSDELQLTVRPLPPLKRTNWKSLLKQICDLRLNFDAQAVVIGLPLRLDGTEGHAALEARRIARNLTLSLEIPIHLQDERLTSRAAVESLRQNGVSDSEIADRIDSEAATIILRDFISQNEPEV